MAIYDEGASDYVKSLDDKVVGFGCHSTKTYRRVADYYRSYIEWGYT